MLAWLGSIRRLGKHSLSFPHSSPSALSKIEPDKVLPGSRDCTVVLFCFSDFQCWGWNLGPTHANHAFYWWLHPDMYFLTFFNSPKPSILPSHPQVNHLPRWSQPIQACPEGTGLMIPKYWGRTGPSPSFTQEYPQGYPESHPNHFTSTNSSKV